jgi:acetyl esterase/lipase
MIIPLIINKIASLTPLHILGRLSADLRYLIEISLKNNEKFSVTSLDSNIQLITYKIDSPNKHISKIVIYLHGGGFVIRDSADLIITERLLPLLARKNSNNIVVVSILYPLAPSTSEFHDSFVINSILTSISKVEKLGSIEAILGDSAGGYLAVQVAEKIKTKKLCLISPWLDLYSYSDSYSRNKQKDFLDPMFLERCRASYLGLERDLYLQLSIASDRYIKYLKESNVKVITF